MNKNSTNSASLEASPCGGGLEGACKQLKFLYYGFFGLAAVLFTLVMYTYSAFAGKEAIVEANSTAGIALATIYILFLICSIPITLKVFNVKVKKLSELESLDEKIERYKKYAFLRMSVMGFNMLLGIGVFYLLNSDSLIFGIAVAAITLVFCKPSEAKMISELNLEEEIEEYVDENEIS